MVLVNARFTPQPLEMAIFTEAFHLDIWNLRRPRVHPRDYNYPLPSRLDQLSPRFASQDETETVLIRKFPFPWQVG